MTLTADQINQANAIYAELDQIAHGSKLFAAMLAASETTIGAVVHGDGWNAPAPPAVDPQPTEGPPDLSGGTATGPGYAGITVRIVLPIAQAQALVAARAADLVAQLTVLGLTPPSL